MVPTKEILSLIRELCGTPTGPIPLHAPIFEGNEAKYVQATIESTFVSSVGEYVNEFERKLASLSGAKYVIAAVNGTTALHMALLLAGVEPGDAVITQSLSFIGTANAIAHAQASPIFVDVEPSSLGMCPDALEDYLRAECELRAGHCYHKTSGKRIAACVPMHTFGHPLQIERVIAICEAWGLPVVEDAAEALGSTINGKGCGSFGLLGSLSFNGNKICTTGGGGAILTNDDTIAKRAKHLTTTAKQPHAWKFFHDAVGYNYRLPNLNAALGCAQLEQLPFFIDYKRALASRYKERLGALGVSFVTEPAETKSIYWLNAILLQDVAERDAFLAQSNAAGVMTRPIWEPLHTLPMYLNCPRGPLDTTCDIANRLVNIPSGVPPRSVRETIAGLI